MMSDFQLRSDFSYLILLTNLLNYEKRITEAQRCSAH